MEPSPSASPDEAGLAASASAPTGRSPKLPERPAKAKAKSDATDGSGAAPSKAMPKLPARRSTKSSNGAGTGADVASSSAQGSATGHAESSTPRGPILDGDEPEDVQKLRHEIHSIRVLLFRAAQRLGYDHDNGLVKQVLYRLNLAEKLRAPWRKGKRPDPANAAAAEADDLEELDGPSSSLGLTIKMMLIGPTGAGKTQMINALLQGGAPGAPAVGAHAGAALLGSDADAASPPATASPLSARRAAESAGPTQKVPTQQGPTQKVQVVSGTVHGIRVECIDTPGLVASAGAVQRNSVNLQSLRRAFVKHKPDLVVYVDRLDAMASTGGELPVLRQLSETLGAGVWLNTIVALTHAGTPPPWGPKGQLPFDTYANQRSHILQQVIRAASGDDRLMNPTTFVESHPGCPTNAAGAPIIANGMPWKAHLYLMIVSAKLLADTENMLQMQTGSGKRRNKKAAAAAAAAAGGALGVDGAYIPSPFPLPYLVSSLTQFSRPLKYPDHDLMLDVRMMELALRSAPEARTAHGLALGIKQRLLQLRRAHTNKARMEASFRNATLAGGKVTPEPPPLATRRTPSVHPAGTFRFRTPEAQSGWVVRPQAEAHAMEASDGFEGLQLEKAFVARRETPGAGGGKKAARGGKAAHASGRRGGDGKGRKGGPFAKGGAKKRQRRGRSVSDRLLGGVPVHHSVVAQMHKGSKTIQARSEATLYHDLLGTTTSTLSCEMQSAGTGAGGPSPTLVTARADVRRRGILGANGKTTLGIAASTVTDRRRWGMLRPSAAGLRLQQTAAVSSGKVPTSLCGCGALMAMLPGDNPTGPPMPPPQVLQMGMGAPHAEASGRSAAAGGNLELQMELQNLFGTAKSMPVTLGANAIRYQGETIASVATAMQYRTRNTAVRGQLALGNKRHMGVSLKIKSREHWWAGVAALTVPLTTALLQAVGIFR